MDRSPAGRGSDRRSYRQSIVELFKAFPDWEAITEDLVVDATTSRVAVRWTATGTHRGQFLGFPPSCKRITFRGIEIVRIEGSQIIERWGEWNGLELLQQLGTT
ncbi:MAG: ester cyclase [Chthoniobacterales bacterium]|nr:ester cyclase [Chthoniobacterales bacterium]